jgi:hypothetical protein
MLNPVPSGQGLGPDGEMQSCPKSCYTLLDMRTQVTCLGNLTLEKPQGMTCGSIIQ